MKKERRTKIIPKKEVASLRTLTLGQRAADKLTKWAGSWTFIISIGFFIFFWIYLNLTAYLRHWDPWPFILLNLFLSCIAALQAPIILMSQNRTTERDRARAEYDYAVNRKAEREITEIKKIVGRLERNFGSKKKR